MNDSVAALRPSVGLAVAVLAPSSPEQLRAFLPAAALIRLGLVALEGDAPLAGRTLRIPSDLWPRLAGMDPVPDEPTSDVHGLDTVELTPSGRTQAETAVRALRDRGATLVVVHGDHSQDTVAAAIAGAAGAFVAASGIDDAGERARLVRAAMWRRAALVVERGATIDDVLRMCRESALPIVAALEGGDLPGVLRASGRTVLEVAIAPIDDRQRRKLWDRACAGVAGVDSARLAVRYSFDPEMIAAAAALAHAHGASRGGATSVDDVDASCRTIAAATARSAGRMIGRLDVHGHGSELVVPPQTQCELELFEEAARHGHRLVGDGRIRGNSGFIALFAGPPGTGKTLAAQIIAQRLGLEVFRVDLSQVVDKYIGETEKHLDRVFRACEVSGAILFFDEADALFGKRTETKDAHDRYANVEAAFLLQRLEQHRGFAVLATNLKHNLDAAFLRRLHFVVEFPLPGHAERRRIWEIHLPRGHIDADVDLDFLTRFELSGADIRNAVTAAAILGAEQAAITMKHLVIAVSRELRKIGRLSQPDDFKPWSAAVVAYLRDGVLR
ncbi:MAG: AAA family ATPase [Deltaproteobacteria bacterium]|nr:AAA family ATPase [Deltaproteobacteria bacterium]